MLDLRLRFTLTQQPPTCSIIMKAFPSDLECQHCTSPKTLSYIKWNYSPSWQLYPPLEICIFLYKTSLQYERFYINKIKKNTQNNLVPRESINPKWRRRTCYFEIWWLNDWFLVSILCLRRWRWLSAALCHNHKHTSLRRSGVKNDHSLRNMF